jgi:hypothetical protein
LRTAPSSKRNFQALHKPEAGCPIHRVASLHDEWGYSLEHN